MSDICRMPQRRDIIVLQDTRSVEVVDKALLLVMLVHALDFVDEQRALDISVPGCPETTPQRLRLSVYGQSGDGHTYHQNNICLGPDFVNIADEFHVVVIVVRAGDVVGWVVVVSADVDDYQICRTLSCKVPFWRVFPVDLVCAPRGIGSAVPLVGLDNLVVVSEARCGCLPDREGCPSSSDRAGRYQGRPSR